MHVHIIVVVFNISRMSRIRKILRSAEKEIPAEENIANVSMSSAISVIESDVNSGVKNGDVFGGDVCRNGDEVTNNDVINVVNNEISDATMRYLEALLSKHEQRLTERFNESEKKLLDKISSLESTVAAKDKELSDLSAHVNRVESEVAVIRAANQHLMYKHDDLEQYGRRMNVRVEGIEWHEHETQQELKEKLEQSLRSIKVDVKEDTFIRFHRSGRPYTKNGKKYAQTIVRLSHWKQRLQAQKGKRIIREKSLPFHIVNDLTKRRYALLKTASSQLPERQDLFAYADANCNLAIRDGKRLYYFNTEEELGEIVQNLANYR